MASSPPTYDQLAQQVNEMSQQITKSTKQVKAKDAQGLVPSGVKIKQPTVFAGTHNGTDVKNFINACNVYFNLVGIADDNTRALFA